MKLKDYLLQYYQQLGVNKMPVEARAQFADLAKNGQLTKEMQKWIDGGFIPNPKTAADDFKKWVSLDQNILPPDANDNAADADGNLKIGLGKSGDDSEWKKMFSAFQAAARGMDENRDDLEDNKDAKAFLENYFDKVPPVNEALFSPLAANAAVDAHIQEFVSFLSTPEGNEFLKFIVNNASYLGIDEVREFLDDIGPANKKYNKDSKVRLKLRQIANAAGSYAGSGTFAANTALDEALKEMNGRGVFNAIVGGFEDDGQISPVKLAFFKRNYQSLLNDLWGKKNLRDEFAKYDGGKISKPLADAMGRVDFKDNTKPTYLKPKREDELTPLQKFSKGIGDSWQDYFGKYTWMRGDRMWYAKDAELIMKAMDGVKDKDGKPGGIKPTGGLAAILDNAAKIKENLQFKSPKAIENFDYFTKMLEEMKATMPKAFAGALSNGQQLDALVSEMAMAAVDGGDKEIDKLKVGLEVLAAAKYGIMTSKIADALRGENITILSDKGLTWNKNGGVQFATKVIDGAANIGLHMAERGIAMVGNAVRLNAGRVGKAEMLDAASKRLNEKYKDEKSALTTLRGKDQDALKGALESNIIQEIYNAQNANDDARVAELIDKLNDVRDGNTDKMNSDNLNEVDADVKFLENQVAKSDKKLADFDKDHLDKYNDIMKWWRFIDGGRETGVRDFVPGSRKAHQVAFDAAKVKQWESFQRAA
ncbi:MAG: hypothetical protein LBL46_03410 [Rickettsiales bacterium]|jgi:hypothetical protein|nr:hypothetical protein [Rickettsiales bacterium]